MKHKSLIIIFILLFSLVHFSPQQINAESNADDSEQEVIDDTTEGTKEIEAEEVDSDADTVTDTASEIDTDTETESQKDEVEQSVDANNKDAEKVDEVPKVDESISEKEGIPVIEDPVTKENDPEVEKDTDEKQLENERELDEPEAETFQLKAQVLNTTQVLKYLVRDARVIELKKDLNQLGFTSFGNPNNFFGTQTEQGVRDFQSYYGLSISGIADQATLNAISDVLASPFQSGKRHKDSIQIKEQLTILGYANFKNPTTYYGVQTRSAIKAFQKANGLPESGIAESTTRSALKAQATTPLQNGMYRDDAIILKENLNKLGFTSFKNPNNYFGVKTEQGVKGFQIYYGLSVSGIGDQATLDTINEVLSSPFQSGKRHKDSIQIKEQLVMLWYAAFKNPTNYFGIQTSAAVKAFKKDDDLLYSGIVEKVTRNKLKELASGPLKIGMSRADASILKNNLNRLGFTSFKNPNNYFGTKTEQGVKDLQTYYNLTKNGVADSATLDTIEEVLSSPFQKGKRHKENVQIKEQLVILGYAKFKNPNNFYGVGTEKAVVEFQKENRLPKSGIVENTTRTKLSEQASKPLRRGMYRDDAIQLKINLVNLGFANFSNPNNFFGVQTERTLKEFQKYFDLPATGVADNKTLSLIAEKLEEEFRLISYENINLTFEQALNIQMAITNPPPQTDLYRNDSAFVSGTYIEFTRPGVVQVNSARARTAPSLDSKVVFTLSNNEKVTILETVTGSVSQGSAEWYKLRHNNQIVYVHARLIDAGVEVASTTDPLNVREATNTNAHVYGVLPEGSIVNVIKKIGNWYEISYQAWRNATRSDTSRYLNPNNNDEFQHLDLTARAGATVSELNAFLKPEKGKESILDGLGEAFIIASIANNVNELYLISHAKLETGNGTSRLATGIEVGLNASGKPIMVTETNRKRLTAIKTTYNMFGVNAFDSCANSCGSVKAYAEGWFTPYDAIVGGAKFIGEEYIHNDNKQNTIYKMRWNPTAMESTGKFGKQYATDIAWAGKQVSNLKNMYSTLSNPLLKFNIVKYK